MMGDGPMAFIVSSKAASRLTAIATKILFVVCSPTLILLAALAADDDRIVSPADDLHYLTNTSNAPRIMSHSASFGHINVES